MKHSKLADGIDHAITEEKKFIPPGVDAEQVGGAGDMLSPFLWVGGARIRWIAKLDTTDGLAIIRNFCLLTVGELIMGF